MRNRRLDRQTDRCLRTNFKLRKIGPRRDVSVQLGPRRGGQEMETGIEADRDQPQNDTQSSIEADENGKEDPFRWRRNDAAFWILGLLNNSGMLTQTLIN